MSIIKIKNAGKVYDIEVDESSTGLDFKTAIAEVTKIPIEKQKILIKGGKLNDDSKLLELKLTQPIMVLGTPNNTINTVDIPKQVFLEDLNQNDLVKVGEDPSGLLNLGNTCYFNSSVQALFHVDDLHDKLAATKVNNGFIQSLQKLFELMTKKQEKINPIIFLTSFRDRFQQFTERDSRGFYKQQDAEESFSQILSLLIEELNVKNIFTIEFKTETKCLGNPSEAVVISNEEALKLMCHIDVKTNFLRDGLLNGVKENITKFNETLQANTEYEISKKIIRTPKYLIVHFVRFFWRRDTQKKSKILRKVQFPIELDISEMLDESIKIKKSKFRDDLRKIEKSNEDLLRDFKKTKKESLNPVDQQEEEKLKLLSIKSKFEDDFASLLTKHDITTKYEELTENPSSVYKLNSIVTHLGSSADSGHYQCFSKDGDNDETWWKFNDDKISKVSREKIEQLSGGGESDSALLLIYKASGL